MPPVEPEVFAHYQDLVDVTHVNAYGLSKEDDYHLLRKIWRMFSVSKNGTIWIFITRDRRFDIDSEWQEIAKEADGFYLIIIQEFLRDKINIMQIGHASRDELKKILFILFDHFYKTKVLSQQ